MSVPKTAEDMKNADNYKVGTVNSGSYVVRENGSSRDFVVGQFENTNVPTILINFTSSADALAAVKDIDTAANNPTMVVNEIETGVDDDDNTVYTINGYFNGAEVSLTTTKNAVLGKLNNKGKNNGIIADQGGSKFYSTTDIWNCTIWC